MQQYNSTGTEACIVGMAQLRSSGTLGGKWKYNNNNNNNHLSHDNHNDRVVFRQSRSRRPTGCTLVVLRWTLVWTIPLLLHDLPFLHRRSHPSYLNYPNYPNAANALAFEAKAAAVRPVWFSSDGYYSSRGEFKFATGEQQQQEGPTSPPQPRRVIFLHGRLEAEEGEPPFAEPARLYSDFCGGLAERIEQHNNRITSTTLPPKWDEEENDDHHNVNDNDKARKPKSQPPRGPSVLMLDYEDLLAKELPREPRDLSLGPISEALAGAISQEIPTTEETTLEEQQQQLVLVSFSMGAAMALKLLDDSCKNTNRNLNNILRDAVTHVVLIEPVWRCWLPFASGPIFQADDNDTIDSIETLAIRGTADDQTNIDSGGNLQASLRPLLPNIHTHTIEGGNHWGILSEAVAGAIAREGMGNRSSSEKAEMMTPELWKAETIDTIASFCGWEC